jgi:hypothetical protein
MARDGEVSGARTAAAPAMERADSDGDTRLLCGLGRMLGAFDWVVGSCFRGMRAGAGG